MQWLHADTITIYSMTALLTQHSSTPHSSMDDNYDSCVSIWHQEQFENFLFTSDSVRLEIKVKLNDSIISDPSHDMHYVLWFRVNHQEYTKEEFICEELRLIWLDLTSAKIWRQTCWEDYVEDEQIIPWKNVRLSKADYVKSCFRM